MPNPPTTDLPKPKSWDEFEDICADILKKIWEDPYIVRNGRAGQQQYGVDCYGMPKHLGGATTKKYAAAQCKKTDELTLKIIHEEVEKAKAFIPVLTEYLFMTTAPRDAKLQEEIRRNAWPFDRVHIMFWDDISLELSGSDELLQKHFPGWMKRTTAEEQVLNMVYSSRPEEFRYDDGTGIFFLKTDVSLRIVLERGEETEREFHEPWVEKFANPHATRQPVYIYYGETRVREIFCVYVDGGRHIIPIPNSQINLHISPFSYHIGKILNHPLQGFDFDYALRRAGISVRESNV